MNYSTYRFTLDIHKARSQVSIPVMYQDTWVRLYVNLTDGGKPYHIAEGCTAVLYGKKADGTALVNDCEVIDNNTRIMYTFNPQTASALGPVECEIRLYSNGLHLTTPSFTILVEERVIEDDDVIESEAELSAIDRILENVEAWEDAETERQEAETGRANAEAAREKEELNRQAAERAREEFSNGWEAEMDSLKDRVDECEKKVWEGGSSADNSQRLEMLAQDVAEHGAAISDINEALGKKADADTMNEALDNKVTKSSGVNHVYATDSSGKHLLLTWAQSASNGTLVRRDKTGHVYANDATLDGQVVNLGQMNAELVALFSDSKSYTDQRFNEILGDGATEALDGIAELARALGEDKNFAASTAAALAKKADATEMATELSKKADATEITRLDNAINGILPQVTALDNDKFLRVVGGKWSAVAIPYAEGEGY